MKDHAVEDYPAAYRAFAEQFEARMIEAYRDGENPYRRKLLDAAAKQTPFQNATVCALLAFKELYNESPAFRRSPTPEKLKERADKVWAKRPRRKKQDYKKPAGEPISRREWNDVLKHIAALF